MHMPGHKRNSADMPDGLPFDIDITEIHGFDDLSAPRGILLETSKLAAKLYGSREAFLLVNGSTVGILAAIGSHAKRGDTIITDANCHRSIPNAAKLFDLKPVYITPEVDSTTDVPCSITPESVEKALMQNPGARLVVITSPSYEGVVSDVSNIAKATHKAGALLLVDCAHGAHLGLSTSITKVFPDSPICLGADMVVVSLHKTLPALTQCALLHVCSERADTVSIQRMIGILQTSSPSYVLMASIDYCLRMLAADAGRLFNEYENNLARFANLVSNLRNLSILGKKPGFFDFDPGKISIVTKNSSLDGVQLAELLREKHNIELERAYKSYAIAMTSIRDTCDAYTRLADALINIDCKIFPADLECNS